MDYPGIDQSAWEHECKYCHEPVDWQFKSESRGYGGGDGDKWVFFEAHCTGNCRAYQRTGETGLTNKKVKVADSWP